MKFYFSLIIISFFSRCFYLVKAENTPADLIVETKNGKLQGTTEKGVCVWRGIPYAQAPIGKLRFKSPQPLANWDGIKQATEFGTVASQTKAYVKTEKVSEDCLFLNIWSPAADGKKRPVMVWIHGGGFYAGSGSSDLYNGCNLVKNGDVVVVTINYRLGALGFLYLNDIASTPTEFESNLGIRDQIAALQWVKNNIENFGGDPNRVTIFGQSAGGTSVLTLLATPSAKGLFANAISESPAVESLWKRKEATEITERFLELVNVPKNNLSLLYTIPADTLSLAAQKLLIERDKTIGISTFSPTIDEVFIPESINDAIKNGQTKDIPLIIGTNKYEANLFKKDGFVFKHEHVHKFLNRFGQKKEEKIIGLYKSYPKEQATLNLVTDAIFRMPTINTADVHHKNAPTWLYRLDWASMGLNITGFKTCHALDIFFVFNSFHTKTGKKVSTLANKRKMYRLSNDIQRYWINFAHTGNPNGADKETWKNYNSTDKPTLLLNKKNKLASNPDGKNSEVWNSTQL